MARFALVLMIVLGFGLNSSGQIRGRVISPEVSPDNKITFRLFAPQATSVRLYGEWITDFTRIENLQKMIPDCSR